MAAHAANRPGIRDWRAAVFAGALLGLLLLGAGGRAGMRVVALTSGQAGIFTIDGTIAVVMLGALTGVVMAAIFLLARTVQPRRRWMRAAIFWLVCLALVLRGLHPVSVLKLSVFAPLFLAHGALLHLYWCRVHLARSS